MKIKNPLILEGFLFNLIKHSSYNLCPLLRFFFPLYDVFMLIKLLTNIYFKVPI